MMPRKITARELRKGDVLEPDGTEVTGFIKVPSRPTFRNMVFVSIKEPGKRWPKSFMIDAGWPLHLRARCEP